MELNDLAAELAKRLGVEIELTQEGGFDLEVDEMPVAVRQTDDGRFVSLLGIVGMPPAERQGVLYAEMLKANHLFAGTQGAALGIEAGSGQISLSRLLERQLLDGDLFYAALEQFIDTLDVWRKIITMIPAQRTTAETGTSEEIGDFGSLEGFVRV